MIFMKESTVLIKEKIKYIVIHCSDTDPNDTAEDIHKLHLSFKWDGIGYHKIITKNGKIENGRPEFWKGAHVYGHNHESLGVCLIGKQNFTKLQMKSLEKLILTWKKKYLHAKVVGHYSLTKSNKTCPNFDVEKWYKTIENRK